MVSLLAAVLEAFSVGFSVDMWVFLSLLLLNPARVLLFFSLSAGRA